MGELMSAIQLLRCWIREDSFPVPFHIYDAPATLIFCFPHHAAKSEMTGRGIDRFGMPRRRPVAAAIVRCAQMRTALDDLARNSDVRQTWIVALVFAAAARICGMQHAFGASASCFGDTSPSSIPRHCRSCRRDRSRSAETPSPARCARNRPAADSAAGTHPARYWPCVGRRA